MNNFGKTVGFKGLSQTPQPSQYTKTYSSLNATANNLLSALRTQSTFDSTENPYKI